MAEIKFITEETAKEIYGIENDKCPICDEKFEYITNIIKLDGEGYHLSCYDKINNRE